MGRADGGNEFSNTLYPLQGEKGTPLFMPSCLRQGRKEACCTGLCGRGTERSAKNFAPVIAATPDFTNVRVPRCGYLVLDKNCQMIDSEIPTF